MRFIIIFILIGSFELHAKTKLTEFLLSFNSMKSNCDKITLQKSYSDGPSLKITLHDLAELGNEEFSSRVPLKKFKFKDNKTATAKRYAHFMGKKVREEYTFKKGDNGELLSVSLKRYKKSLIRYRYSLGGIICRAE